MRLDCMPDHLHDATKTDPAAEEGFDRDFISCIHDGARSSATLGDRIGHLDCGETLRVRRLKIE